MEDNVDYDEIKAFIKEKTTPGNGTALSIPGTGNAQVKEVEEALFDILSQEHKRINLFVWSKTGEIKRRLGEFPILRTGVDRACMTSD